MGSTKEWLYEVQEERARAWIEDNFPNAEEGTEEFDAAAQEHDWMLDSLAEEAERKWFQDSLNDLDDRYIHAVRELDELKELVTSAHAGIVFRIAYAHTVTVMEAFLMYSARALLNDPGHLERFYKVFASNNKVKGTLRKCAQAVLGNTQKQPDGIPSDESSQRRRTAQLYVSQQTFHNLENLQGYFSSVLEFPYEWPFKPLKYIIETRQDLVHRNGVSKHDERVCIGSWHLEHAIRDVRAFVDAVALTLRRETGAGGCLPQVLPRDSF